MEWFFYLLFTGLHVSWKNLYYTHVIQNNLFVPTLLFLVPVCTTRHHLSQGEKTKTPIFQWIFQQLSCCYWLSALHPTELHEVCADCSLPHHLLFPQKDTCRVFNPNCLLQPLFSSDSVDLVHLMSITAFTVSFWFCEWSWISSQLQERILCWQAKGAQMKM